MCVKLPITVSIIDSRTNPATSVYTSNHLVVDVIDNSNADILRQISRSFEAEKYGFSVTPSLSMLRGELLPRCLSKFWATQ